MSVPAVPVPRELRNVVSWSSVDAFYRASEWRLRSGETDYGVLWRLDGALYRVSAVHDTGEIYAVAQPGYSLAGRVFLIGYFTPGRKEDAEDLLAGWADRDVLDLRWVLDRLRPTRTRDARAEVEYATGTGQTVALTGTARPGEGEPFPCPSCGRTDGWRADYYQAVSQGVELVAGKDGEPYPFPTDYRGDEKSYDDGSTENEAYRCACGHEIALGEFRLVRPAACPATMAEVNAAVERDRDEDRSEAIGFVLDGLGVESLSEAHRLVQWGRTVEAANWLARPGRTDARWGLT